MTLHFAPLQGYVDHLYRRFHAEIYGAADVYYTPFIRVEKGEARRQDMTRLEKSIGDGTTLVPQIIFNSEDEFKALTEAVKQAGYNRIDLNLGCPYPMQTRKGRGASVITDLKLMESVAKLMAQDTDTKYSIKMRLGLNSPQEWENLMPVLNSLDLVHITMHPRIAKQMYGGELFADEFKQFASTSKNPVIWNGDILTPADIDRTASEYRQIEGIMIGRGMLACPSLIAEWREGTPWTPEQRLERLLEFHALLYDAYRDTLCGAAQILQKIKPFWEYLEPSIGHKTYKAIHKATTLEKYNAAIESLN